MLAGFCLLAAIPTRAFLQSMTQRLLREVAEAMRMAREAKDDAGQARMEVGAAERIIEDARPKLDALAASLGQRPATVQRCTSTPSTTAPFSRIHPMQAT